MESKHLGAIRLDGGDTDAVVPIGDHEVPLRLTIADPGKADEKLVAVIDIAIDNLGALDGLARDTIAAAVGRPGSAAEQLFRAWRSSGPPSFDDDPTDFLRRLRPEDVTLLPDGGRAHPDRVVMSYGVADLPASGAVTVRFREPTGPELDPYLRGAAG